MSISSGIKSTKRSVPIPSSKTILNLRTVFSPMSMRLLGEISEISLRISESTSKPSDLPMSRT
jgi:hypothetical protein